MNTPNKLSLLRILIVPFIILFLLPISIFSFEPIGWNQFVAVNGKTIAGILFVIASLTDMADGKIARKYNLITNLGKFLDSLADKMLVISVMIALVEIGRISSVFVIIIVLREFMVTGIRLLASEKGVVMAAAMIGKIKTVLQMGAIGWLLFEPLLHTLILMVFPRIDTVSCMNVIVFIGDFLIISCVIMTIISGIDYLLKNLDYFKESK